MQYFWLSLHTPKTTLIFPSGILIPRLSHSIGHRILITQKIIRGEKRLAQAVLVRLIILDTIPRDYVRKKSILWGKISFPLQRFAEGATRR